METEAIIILVLFIITLLVTFIVTKLPILYIPIWECIFPKSGYISSKAELEELRVIQDGRSKNESAKVITVESKIRNKIIKIQENATSPDESDSQEDSKNNSQQESQQEEIPIQENQPIPVIHPQQQTTEGINSARSVTDIHIFNVEVGNPSIHNNEPIHDLGSQSSKDDESKSVDENNIKETSDEEAIIDPAEDETSEFPLVKESQKHDANNLSSVSVSKNEPQHTHWKEEFYKDVLGEDFSQKQEDFCSTNKVDKVSSRSPLRCEIYWLPVSIAYGSLVSLFVLFASLLLSWSTFINSLSGNEGGVAAYSVLIIFFSFAYICLSLDATELFKAIAMPLLDERRSKWTLFFFFQILASIMTLFTSNDIVILTLTPILSYVAKKQKKAGVNPIAFAIPLFYMSNITSILFVVSNPTNVIVAEAEKLNFGEYSLWMLIPTIILPIVAAIASTLLFFPFLIGKRRTTIEEGASRKTQTDLNSIDQGPNNETLIIRKTSLKTTLFNAISVISDPTSVIVKSLGLIVALIALFVTSFFGIPSWIVCLCVLAFFVIWDLLRDSISISYSIMRKVNIFSKSQNRSVIPQQTNMSALSAGTFEEEDNKENPGVRDNKENPGVRNKNEDESSIEKKKAVKDHVLPFLRAIYDIWIFFFKRSHFLRTLKAMPWAIAPFVVCLFVYVELLRIHGWIDILAEGIVATIRFFSFGGDTHDAFGVIFSSILVLNVFGIIASNLINNQPATILFIIVFQSRHTIDFFANSPYARQGALLSLTIASNIGVCFTLYGSLAGVMWQSLLKKYNIRISYCTFLFFGTIVVTCLSVVSTVLLTGEVLIAKQIKPRS